MRTAGRRSTVLGSAAAAPRPSAASRPRCRPSHPLRPAGPKISRGREAAVGWIAELPAPRAADRVRPMADPASDRPHVMRVYSRLEVGGIEQQMLRVLPRLNAEGRYRVSLCLLKRPGELA